MMMVCRRTFLGIFTVWAALSGVLQSCQSETAIESSLVQVERILSGQTFEIRSGQGSESRVERVRLLGIDAPDFRQTPWGPDAQQHLTELIGSRPVRLEFDGETRDREGRLLAYAWQDSVLIDEQMVADGHALARTQGLKYADRLGYAQDYARILGLGIWDPENPLRVSPQAFRRRSP